MRKSSDGRKEPPKKQKKLSWSQEAYDWNRDGKLSTLEWGSWYWNMYGEEEERRRRKACRQRQEREADQTVPVSVSISSVRISFYVDLARSWNDMKAALKTLAPVQYNTLLPLLSKVLLHEISEGIRQLLGEPEPQRMQELKDFLDSTPDLHLDGRIGTILRNIKSNALYTREGELSAQCCGSFWSDVLKGLSSEQYYQGRPEGLSDLLSELSSLYTYFGGKDGEEWEVSNERDRKYKDALYDAFYLHWQKRVLLHPNVERAKELLSHGEFPDGEDICRDILVTEFPEEAAEYPLDKLENKNWKDILDNVFSRDVPKAIRMWRTLLDIASPCLHSDKDAAKELLPDWDVLNSLTPDTAEAFFSALLDDTFARQIFQSACIWDLQRDLLSACYKFDRPVIGQHCLDLALENPHLTESWERRLRYALSASKASISAQRRRSFNDDIPDDGTVFHYCSVQVQGTRRPYAYLTGGLPLKVGDWVELPFGKDDVLRQGQIKAVMDCTRMVAPWPPEQTKTVIRTIDAPAVKPTIEVAVPTSPKRVEQPKKEAEKIEVPVIPAPETKPEEPKAESQVTEPVVSEKDEKKPVPPPKPFPFKKIIAAVLAVAVIAGISISLSSRNKQRAAAYEAALQELSNGNYTSAEQDFSALSGYRDAASLSIYCKYADMYKGKTEYVGGQDELATITLKYDTSWQQDVDALETRVKSYKAEKDAAEEAERKRIAAENAAKQEQSRKDQYSGKLPVDGMPVSCLKYTSIGSPTKTEKCQFYDNMDVHRRYKILHWYNSEGQTVAYCHSHQPKGETEEIIYAFTYYVSPIGRPNSAPPWTPPSTSGGNNSGSIRDDYDNPEDLWEENQDWYKDEDEAWDEWENG